MTWTRRSVPIAFPFTLEVYLVAFEAVKITLWCAVSVYIIGRIISEVYSASNLSCACIYTMMRVYTVEIESKPRVKLLSRRQSPLVHSQHRPGLTLRHRPQKHQNNNPELQPQPKFKHKHDRDRFLLLSRASYRSPTAWSTWSSTAFV